MSASDDYLRGRRDAIDEILHLMSEYAMVGGSDRDLRRELKRMRDDASRTLAVEDAIQLHVFPDLLDEPL